MQFVSLCETRPRFEVLPELCEVEVVLCDVGMAALKSHHAQLLLGECVDVATKREVTDFPALVQIRRRSWTTSFQRIQRCNRRQHGLSSLPRPRANPSWKRTLSSALQPFPPPNDPKWSNSTAPTGLNTMDIVPANSDAISDGAQSTRPLCKITTSISVSSAHCRSHDPR